MINDYKRGMTDEEIRKLLKDCKDKVEGITKTDWQDLVDKYNLDCCPDVLRKAFTGIMGGYSIYRFLTEGDEKTGIDEIREELGRMEIIQRDIRDKKSKIQQINRNLSKTVGIADDLKYYLKYDLQNIEKMPFKRLKSNEGYKLIVCVSDWHIGYIIRNYKGNNYNYEIARNRLKKLLSEIEKMCIRYNITDVVICQLGDITEGAYMRETQQAFECEFNFAEQVSKAIKLLYEFTTAVSEIANVELITVGGNHSRVSTKASNIDGDNFNVVIRDMLEVMTESNERIKVAKIDTITDSHRFTINGLNVKVTHGDKSPKDAKKLFDTETSLEGEKIDLILRGHYHNFEIETQNNGGCVITCGCLFGYNLYSNNIIRSNSNASQCLIVVGESEIECIKNVNLQFNN